MASPRYIAEHLIMPGFLREQCTAAVLDAIERSDTERRGMGRIGASQLWRRATVHGRPGD